MKPDKATSATRHIDFSREDLQTLKNALNEVCHGLDVEDFSIRLGAERAEVIRLMHRIGEALHNSA